MEHSIMKLTLGALFLAVAIGTHAEEKKAPANKTAIALENMASQTKTEAEFGRAVRTQSLLAAARAFRKGTSRGNAVRIPVTVVVTELPPKHGDLPDVCFETCLDYGQSSALTCYIDCNAPRPPGP